MRVWASTVERYYGVAFRSVLKVVNTVKKRVYKNECKVHQFINNQSLRIIYESGHYREYELLEYYKKDLNKGVVWADQDFKSIGHFYNPIKERGLYGHYNALYLAEKYYNLALDNWNNGLFENAIFNLGACVHLIQDVTIPQHVNIRLLDKHRKFESYVKKIYKRVKEYKSHEEIIYKNNVKEYICYNAYNAIHLYNSYNKIENDKDRFRRISLEALPLAQQSTAGCMLMFLKDVCFIDNTVENTM
ncbi:zinc dependent phospholipase C family protein [Abyssisolibacter fermentans]|uniref:zinc dependent phospholipase C family protein n=1 Tax=Abyssisolibacter fermentans TaxID=1766203 RepID=UPI00082972FA|nr:zinc dependent phospholipase C family protein [Abyssisolibacter fermentans]